MFKIQDILLKNTVFDGEKDLYYRSEFDIELTDDNGVKLEKERYYDFFTFFNALSMKIYSQYTIADNYNLVIEAKGDFKLELFGMAGKDKNYQKEWLGVHSFSYSSRKKIVIPIEPVFSEKVSFGILCNSDTYVYDAYYASNIDEKKLSTPVLQVVSCLPDDEYEADKKRKYMIGEILNDPVYKDNILFEFCQSDVKKLSDIKLSKGSDKVTNVLFLGGNYVSDDVLKRLYLYLRLLKREYRDTFITGSVIELENPGYKLIERENSEIGATVVSKSLLSTIDIMNNETGIYEEPTAIELSGFVCVPLSYLKKRKGDCAKSVHLNGLCAYGNGLKEKYNSIFKANANFRLHKLQDILFDEEKSIEITRHMYYRSPVMVSSYRYGGVFLPKDNLYDFFTYFNAFSLEKWKKYTHLRSLYLVIEAKGSFTVEIFGHYKKNADYQKEICGKHFYNNDNSEAIYIRIPDGLQSTLVGFNIFTHSDVVINRAYYATNIDKAILKKPLISMVTTTFKKEEYVNKNIELLSDNLLNDDDFKDFFIWNIIDNGNTFELPDGVSDRIRLFSNKNVGGAGGFAKGMIVSLTQKEKPDYILLMDDDVVFIPESFKRLYSLLSMLKDEFKDYFVSGAMLKMGQPNVQHEDTGKLIQDGYHVAVKPNYDLNLWNHIIDNEIINEKTEHQYGAWWFCCIPTSVANLNNLPVPVFVRGDDVEYSLRNNAKFITMNGLCIWHEGFEGKFSAALEFYQVNRNELAVRAMHPELHDVDCIGHIKTIFWEEMYKFNYKGAGMLLDAVEDYMKGPEFYKRLNGEKSLGQKRKRDHKLLPITPEIAAQVDFDKLYEYEGVSGKIKTIYDYTYNGQARIPELFIKDKTGVIPYGWGYFPGKMCLTKQNIAVDKTTQTYVIYKKSRARFKKLKERYERVINKYNSEHKIIEKRYQDASKELTSEAFWKEYLS